VVVVLAGAPEIMLLLRMPEFVRALSGMQLRQQLAVPDQVLRVVILSGHADATAAVQAMKLGAIDLLTKPVEDPLLCATVKEACRLSLEELS
jgi:two-component system, LuxR family, response regulator FixJ